jgi:hypothetical protein
MKMEELLNLDEKNSNIFFEKDVFNENRYYIYEQGKGGLKSAALAYISFGSGDTGISCITLYSSMIRYIEGRAKYMLTYDILNKSSYIVRNFSGLPTKRETVIDIPRLGLKSYAYIYPEKNFIVTRHMSENGTTLTFSFVLDVNHLN